MRSQRLCWEDWWDFVMDLNSSKMNKARPSILLTERKKKTEHSAPSSWLTPLQEVWVQSELVWVVAKYFFAMHERGKVITLFKRGNLKCNTTKSNIAFSFIQLLSQYVCIVIHFPLCYPYHSIFLCNTSFSVKNLIQFLLQTYISQGKNTLRHSDG